MPKVKSSSFYKYKNSQGMVLRSGRTINCQTSTTFVKDFKMLISTCQFVIYRFRNFRNHQLYIPLSQGRTYLDGDAFLDEIYTSIAQQKATIIDNVIKVPTPEINWVPEFIRGTLVTRTLCQYCMTIDLILSFLTEHKQEIRVFRDTSHDGITLQNILIRKLTEAETFLEKNINNSNPKSCLICEKLTQTIGLPIQCYVTTKKRLEMVKHFLYYLRSPTSKLQQTFFALASTGLPESVSKNIISYL